MRGQRSRRPAGRPEPGREARARRLPPELARVPQAYAGPRTHACACRCARSRPRTLTLTLTLARSHPRRTTRSAWWCAHASRSRYVATPSPRHHHMTTPSLHHIAPSLHHHHTMSTPHHYTIPSPCLHHDYTMTPSLHRWCAATACLPHPYPYPYPHPSPWPGGARQQHRHDGGAREALDRGKPRSTLALHTSPAPRPYPLRPAPPPLRRLDQVPKPSDFGGR